MKSYIVVAILAIAIAVMAAATVYAAPVNVTVKIDAPYSVDGKSVDIFTASDLGHVATEKISGDTFNASLDPGTYILKADFGNTSLIAAFTVDENTSTVELNMSTMGTVEFNITGYTTPIVYDVEINYSDKYSGGLVFSTSDKLYFNKPVKISLPSKIGGPLVFYRLKEIKLDGNKLNTTEEIKIDELKAHTIEATYEKTYITSTIDPIYYVFIVVAIAVVAAAFMYFKKGHRYESIINTYNSRYIE